jgi:glycosyltransferase involved in cell wall biosynthesis
MMRDAAAPAISVVIPAFNARATVTSAIRSALGQSIRDVEVVVVDDGSSDDTAEVVRALREPRVRLVQQHNRGLPAARNAGLESSRGAHIAFLDSDDLLLPRYVELALAALARTERPGFAYTDAYVFDPRSGQVRRRSAMARSRPPFPAPDDPGEFLARLLQANFVYVSTVVPRTVLRAVGGFDERRTSSEDYELWLRILLHGFRAAWVPGRHALYRQHPGQMSADARTMASNLAAVYEGIAAERLPSDAHRRLLARRRRAARLGVRLVAPIQARAPLGAIRTLKRRGMTEEWYEPAPPEVAAAFPNLREV